MIDHDQPPTLTRSRVVRELRLLLDDLTERATPIDFRDLERRGVLQKAPHEKGWYLVLKPAELPASARQQALGGGQTTLGNRTVPMLWFKRSTNKKAAALLAKIRRAVPRAPVTH